MKKIKASVNKKETKNIQAASTHVKNEALELPVLDLNGKHIETLKLDEKIFDHKVNKALLYQAVNMYRANTRQGTASTKTRGEVSGGGKKPWRQKGTGRARAGSIRAPIFKGGGTVFGPHPRDFSYRLSQTMRQLALKSSINDRLNNNNIVVIDQINIENINTKEASNLLNKLKINDKCLIGLDSPNKKAILSFRNIPRIEIKLAKDITALDVLLNKKLLLSKKSWDIINKRIEV